MRNLEVTADLNQNGSGCLTKSFCINAETQTPFFVSNDDKVLQMGAGGLRVSQHSESNRPWLVIAYLSRLPFLDLSLVNLAINTL